MRSRAAVNRTVLALAGSALMACASPGGGFTLHEVAQRAEEAVPGARIWAGCLGLLAGVLLLAAQTGRRAPARLPLPGPGCSLDRRAVRLAVQAGCAQLPGVVRARCRLAGRGRRLRLVVVLRLTGRARPGETVAAVAEGLLPQFAALLAPRRLDTRIHVTVRRPVRARGRRFDGGQDQPPRTPS